MTRLPHTLFLGFMHNTYTGEHFIAPAEGANPSEAESKLREVYPSAVYAMLTIYQAQAVEKYLNDVQRWPTLPSRVQPNLADLLATQRIRTQMGGLPPLPKERTQAANPNSSFNYQQIQQIKTIAKGMPAETQALAARLLAGSMPKAVETPAAPTPVTRAPAVAAPMAQAQPVRAAMPTPLPQAQAAAPRPAAIVASVGTIQRAPAAMSARVEVSNTTAPKGGNLKDALAAMRAFNQSGRGPSAFSQPATPTPQAQARPVQTSTLPASARGVMKEDATPAPASPFAVGKVSAINVLKALRTAR